MADYTQNINLKKPLQTEHYNVDDFNGNADIIDEEIKALQDANSGLAGAGRTTETVKGNADDLAAHLADDKTDAHEIININGLQTALNSKAPNVHSHSTSNITDLRIYNGELQYLDGGVWKGVAISPIKSIQRGVVESSASGDINVTINSVNINKAIVLTSGDGIDSSNAQLSYYAVLSSSTKLVVKQRRHGTYASDTWVDGEKVSLAWQVVEFN